MKTPPFIQILIVIIISAGIGFFASWKIPVRQTVIVTQTVQGPMISILTEQKKCDKLGGNFYMIPTNEQYFEMIPMGYNEDHLGWTIGCEQPSKSLFDYTISQ